MHVSSSSQALQTDAVLVVSSSSYDMHVSSSSQALQTEAVLVREIIDPQVQRALWVQGLGFSSGLRDHRSSGKNSGWVES